MRYLALAALFAASAMAQAPEEVLRAKQLFSSTTLKDQAWGAYLSGILHDESLNSLLIERFADARRYSDAKSGTEEHAYVLALFDALIQSEKAVPVGLLLAYRQGWPDEVLILIARAKDTEDALLNLPEESLRDAQWLTVNNLLLGLNSSRFFVRTLQAAHIAHTFIFVSPEAGGGIGSGAGGGGVGDGTRQLPKDFPPIGLYQLVDFGYPGCVIVSNGPRNTFCRKTIVPGNGQAGWGAPFSRQDKSAERIEYLAAMTGSDLSRARAIFSATTSLKWNVDTDWAAEFDRDLAAQAFSIQDFATTAAQRGVQGLKGLKLTILPQIEDLREVTTEPLPTVPSKTFTLQ